MHRSARPAPTIVFASSRVVRWPPYQRGDAGLVADAVAERGEEPAPVFGPVVVDGLARLDVDEVAAVLGKGARDRDPVLDRVPAWVPVGDGEPHRQSAWPDGTHGVEDLEREAQTVAVGIGERGQEAGQQIAVRDVELEHGDVQRVRSHRGRDEASRTAAMPASSSSAGTGLKGP